MKLGNFIVWVLVAVSFTFLQAAVESGGRWGYVLAAAFNALAICLKDYKGFEKKC